MGSEYWIAWAIGLFCFGVINLIMVCVLILRGRTSQEERETYGE